MILSSLSSHATTSKRIQSQLSSICSIDEEKKTYEKHKHTNNERLLEDYVLRLFTQFILSFAFSRFIHLLYNVLCDLLSLEYRAPNLNSKKGFQKQIYKQKFTTIVQSLITDSWVPMIYSIFHSNHFRITTIFGRVFLVHS